MRSLCGSKFPKLPASWHNHRSHVGHFKSPDRYTAYLSSNGVVEQIATPESMSVNILVLIYKVVDRQLGLAHRQLVVVPNQRRRATSTRPVLGPQLEGPKSTTVGSGRPVAYRFLARRLGIHLNPKTLSCRIDRGGLTVPLTRLLREMPHRDAFVSLDIPTNRLAIQSHPRRDAPRPLPACVQTMAGAYPDDRRTLQGIKRSH